VNQEALERELRDQGIPFQAQPTTKIYYKGLPLNKTYQPDLVCFDSVVVELKALSSLSGTEAAQMINYLKATGMNVGLLLNFGSESLEFKRFVYSPDSA
jgi:GxxExxY protein